MAPVSDFYKKLALECSTQQIAVDLFVFSGQFVDLPTICESCDLSCESRDLLYESCKLLSHVICCMSHVSCL